MDESAFRAFYESTRHGLWAYILKVTGEKDVTDDLFQEAYVRLLQSSAGGLTDIQRKAYLYRIATNLITDHWRKLKRERKWFQPEPREAEVNNEARDVELQHDLSDALQHLAPQQRSMVWLAYVEEYSHREIAEMLKLREKSVKVLLFRAKQKLLEIFEHKGITSEVVS